MAGGYLRVRAIARLRFRPIMSTSSLMSGMRRIGRVARACSTGVMVGWAIGCENCVAVPSVGSPEVDPVDTAVISWLVLDRDLMTASCPRATATAMNAAASGVTSWRLDASRSASDPGARWTTTGWTTTLG